MLAPSRILADYWIAYKLRARTWVGVQFREEHKKKVEKKIFRGQRRKSHTNEKRELSSSAPALL
jgi:hypothetical protein